MSKTPLQIGQQSPNQVDTDNASKQSFVETITSGTGFQVSTVQNAHVYIDVTTSAALAIALSRDGVTYTTVMASKAAGIGLLNVMVPAGWYLKLTGTVADFTVTAIMD